MLSFYLLGDIIIWKRTLEVTVQPSVIASGFCEAIPIVVGNNHCEAISESAVGDCFGTKNRAY